MAEKGTLAAEEPKRKTVGAKGRDDAIKFSSRLGTGILEDLRALARRGHLYHEVAEKINSLPEDERKNALVEFIKASMEKSTVDPLDLSAILERVRMPEKDKAEVVRKWHGYLYD